MYLQIFIIVMAIYSKEWVDPFKNINNTYLLIPNNETKICDNINLHIFIFDVNR